MSACARALPRGHHSRRRGFDRFEPPARSDPVPQPRPESVLLAHHDSLPAFPWRQSADLMTSENSARTISFRGGVRSDEAPIKSQDLTSSDWRRAETVAATAPRQPAYHPFVCFGTAMDPPEGRRM